MTTTLGDRDRVREASWLVAVLAEEWGVVGPRLEAHDAGMNSRTWLVEAGGERYVAKAVPADQHNRFVSGLAVAALAEAGGVSTGAAVPTHEGGSWTRVGDHTLALLRFVNGRPLDGDDPEQQRIIGETLARAHGALVGRDLPGAARFHWLDPAADHLAITDWLRPAIADALDAWDRLPPSSLTWGLLHSDPAPEAFLLDPSTGTCGLIDWDTGLVGPLMYDVASAVMYLGGPERSSGFLASYLESSPVPPAEADGALEPMLRLRWAVQADYFAARIRRNDLTGISDASENEEGLEDARRALLGDHGTDERP